MSGPKSLARKPVARLLKRFPGPLVTVAIGDSVKNCKFYHDITTNKSTKNKSVRKQLLFCSLSSCCTYGGGIGPLAFQWTNRKQAALLFVIFLFFGWTLNAKSRKYTLQAFFSHMNV